MLKNKKEKMFYIAFRMLVGDRGKYLGIILGLSFASLIMTQQPGIFTGIMTRAYSFVTDLGLPDVWVMEPTVRYIDDIKPMPETYLYRVASVEGVAWAKPLYKGTIQARLHSGTFQTCNVIGIDDATLIGAPAVMLQGTIEGLHRADGIIVNEEGSLDKLANPPEYPGGPKIPLRVGQTLELNNHRAIVVGIAKTTRAFQSQPVIFTTYSNATLFAPPQLNLLSFILVKAKTGENLKELCERIKRLTGLAAYTSDDFKDLTVQYYLKYTAIPINFGVSVLLGFLVGAAIAGQTFYNFTLENLRYFLRYESGLINFITVYQTEITYQAAELSLVQSQAALAIDSVALYKALGGGWEIDSICWTQENAIPCNVIALPHVTNRL